MILNEQTRVDVRAFGEVVTLSPRWRAGSYHLRGSAGPIAIEVHDFRATVSPTLKGWWAVFLVPELPPLGRMGKDPLHAVRRGDRFVHSVIVETEKRLREAGQRMIKIAPGENMLHVHETTTMHASIMSVLNYIEGKR